MEAMKAARDHGPWLCGKQSHTPTKSEDVEKMVAMKAIKDYGPRICGDMVRIVESEERAAAEAKAEDTNIAIVVDDDDGPEDSQVPDS
jgi:hypothetical protein